MNEYVILYTAFGSLLGLAFACLFYGLGGRAGKWRRRYVSSLITAVTVGITAVIMGKWTNWIALIYPILVLGYSLGYDGGHATMAQRIFKRTYITLACVSAGLVFCLNFGGKAWVVMVPHVAIGIWSVYMGTRNPIEAAAEEVYICAMLTLGLHMYPFIVGV